MRLATLDDYAQIDALDLSFDSTHVWKVQTFEEPDKYSVNFEKTKLPKQIHVLFQAYNAQAMESMIRRQEILTVRYEKEIVGYVRLELDEAVNRLVIKTGGIAPQFRRKGIGDMLLQQVEEIAQRNDIHYVVCMLQAKNDPAIRFFMRHGFRFCGYQEFYFPNMEIGLFFSRNIR